MWLSVGFGKIKLEQALFRHVETKPFRLYISQNGQKEKIRAAASPSWREISKDELLGLFAVCEIHPNNRRPDQVHYTGCSSRDC